MAYPRSFRLTRSKDINKALRSRSFADGSLLRVYWAKNNLRTPRFAFLISRKVSRSAVKRNLLRRRVQEWIRKNKISLREGTDTVIFFKKEAADAARRELYRECAELFL